MSKVVVACVAGLGLLGVMGREASAATADGTLITNVATATFSTATNAGYTVSYAVTSPVLVQNPCVSLVKVPDLTIQAAGGTVTYTLWVINCSLTVSAFNITITDKVPDNVAFDASRTPWAGLSGGTWYPSTSPNGLAPWTAGYPAAGQVTPEYMRFLMDILGPGKSAYMRYSVVIL